MQRSEQALRLEAIFNTVIDGIITINRRGLIESINPAAANLFGYTSEEVIGNNVKMLMPEPYHGEHDGYIHNYKTTRKKKIIGSGREVKGQRKDGSVFPFFLSVSELEFEGKVIYTGIIHDISDLKKAENAVRESRYQLNAIINNAVDGIITMYHDQGQIALKIMGFDRGVTVHGGIPFPVTTPAHGTAFDITGTGTADVTATREAFTIACNMVANWEKSDSAA